MNEPPNPFQPPQAPVSGPERVDPAAGLFAACPRCGQATATRVGFTLWGGVLGPKLFTHVKCHACGNKYNGKTGRSNATVIVIYTVGSMVVGVIFAVAFIALMWR